MYPVTSMFGSKPAPRETDLNTALENALGVYDVSTAYSTKEKITESYRQFKAVMPSTGDQNSHKISFLIKLCNKLGIENSSPILERFHKNNRKVTSKVGVSCIDEMTRIFNSPQSVEGSERPAVRLSRPILPLSPIQMKAAGREGSEGSDGWEQISEPGQGPHLSDQIGAQNTIYPMVALPLVRKQTSFRSVRTSEFPVVEEDLSTGTKIISSTQLLIRTELSKNPDIVELDTLFNTLKGQYPDYSEGLFQKELEAEFALEKKPDIKT